MTGNADPHAGASRNIYSPLGGAVLTRSSPGHPGRADRSYANTVGPQDWRAAIVEQ